MRRSYMPISGIRPDEVPGIKLTAEQEQLRKELFEKQEQEEKKYQDEMEQEEAQRKAKMVSFILDTIHDHPFLQTLYGIKKQKPLDQLFTEVVLPAIITSNPLASAQLLADKAAEIGKALAKHFEPA